MAKREKRSPGYGELGGRIDQIVALAQEQAEGLVAEARAEAERIIAAARQQADEIRAEARGDS